MMLFLVKYIFLIINFLNIVCATAYYCDNDYCSGELYCCGHNECCANVMTMWYFWFALLIGVIITCLLVCKYNSRVSNDLLPIVWPSPQQQQQQQQKSALSSSSNILNEHYLYKPLRNHDDYLDQKFSYKVTSTTTASTTPTSINNQTTNSITSSSSNNNLQSQIYSNNT